MYQEQKVPKISIYFKIDKRFFYIYQKMGFTPCKTEQPLQGMELLEKELKQG